MKSFKNKYFFLLLFIVLLVCSLFFLSTCSKKNDQVKPVPPTPPEPDTSWISYKDDTTNSSNNEIVKVDMPYCDENVTELCKNVLSNYDICTNIDDLTIKVNIPHDKINGIHFGEDWDEMIEAPDYFCGYLFADNEDILNLEDVNLPKNITECEDYFCAYMFSGSQLLSLPTSFNFPQQITKVGDHFCGYMFDQCQFRILPTSFNLPQQITTIGTHFCDRMFESCSELSALPTSFNLPPQIETIGTDFCTYMFEECNSLKTLSVEFKLPQITITSAESEFCIHMFYHCDLTYNDSIPGTRLHIPNATPPYVDFCANMFVGNTNLNNNGHNYSTPIPGQDVPISRL